VTYNDHSGVSAITFYTVIAYMAAVKLSTNRNSYRNVCYLECHIKVTSGISQSTQETKWKFTYNTKCVHNNEQFVTQLVSKAKR